MTGVHTGARTLGVVAGLAGLLACVARGGEVPREAVASLEGDGPPTADSAVGRVAVVGPEPVSWVVLVRASGAQLRLQGTGTPLLRSIPGVEVVVRGHRSQDEFDVTAFTVLRVNGIPVDDGVVMTSPSGVRLRLHTGEERDVPNAPTGLRELSGRRVWVSRPVAGVTPSFGALEHR